MNIFTIALAVFLICMVVWNFVPAIRAKMRGWSTKIEAVIGVVMYYVGAIGDGLKEAQAAGLLPDGFEKYLPMFLLAWIIWKRVQTTTPAFKKVQ